MEVNYAKSENKTQAFESVKGAITPELMAKFQVKADVNYNENDGVIVASGKGFELTCKFFEDKVSLDLNLSLMLRPFKNKVLDSIKRQVERVV
jgi:hypothetical protein